METPDLHAARGVLPGGLGPFKGGATVEANHRTLATLGLNGTKCAPFGAPMCLKIPILW